MSGFVLSHKVLIQTIFIGRRRNRPLAPIVEGAPSAFCRRGEPTGLVPAGAGSGFCADGKSWYCLGANERAKAPSPPSGTYNLIDSSPAPQYS
jgi:hypothetical protein